MRTPTDLQAANSERLPFGPIDAGNPDRPAARPYATTGPEASASDLASAAGDALGRRAWGEARDLFGRHLAFGETAAALEGLAFAAWWQDDADVAIAMRERAYALRREQGQDLEAARVAALLAWDYGALRGVNAVANGWLQRARSLIADGHPAAEHAWLALIEASFHIDSDSETVLRLSGEAAEQARTLGVLDIEMTARTLMGLALVSLGRMQEGTRLLDEGTAAAIAGELHDPIAIGSCCCNMIIACERARDFERADQWCEQLAAFSERTGQQPLLALCRAHHGAVRLMRGDWARAEDDLTWAAEALARLRPPLAGYARARLAQLRRRQGRPADARAELGRAGTHVLAPLVEAELSLADGDLAGVIAHAERHLRALADCGPFSGAAALELLVEARTGRGEIAEAEVLRGRLAQIAAGAGTDALRAAERCAAGVLFRAQDDHDRARAAFEDAVHLYQGASMPFEAARSGLELARALHDEGRSAAALEQALVARSVLVGLGAEPATRAADKLVTELGGRSQSAERAGLTRREVEVLALIAQGLSNRQIAGRLFVSEHTIHRHVANIHARLGVSSRAAAVALAAARGLI